MMGNYITANRQQLESTPTKTQLACPKSELRDLVSKYTDQVMELIYAEPTTRMSASEKKGLFHLPARKEKRKSLGLDRSSIPEAQIGWLVSFYWKDDVIATGIVRKFLPRETKCDLVIVRLLSELDVEPLVKEIDRFETKIELKVNCEDPKLFKRCKRFFLLRLRLKRLRLSPVAMEVIFGDLDKAQTRIVWPPPSDLETELPLPKRLSFKLNEDQNYCLRRAISRQATIIDGIVGSGKTHLAACIAYCLAYERNLKVLICSPHTGTADLISKLLTNNKIFIDDDEHRLSVVRVTDEKRVARKEKNSSSTKLDHLRSSKIKYRTGNSGKLSDLVEYFLRERISRRLEKVQDCFPKIQNPCGDSKELQMIERCVQLASRKTIKEAENKVLRRADIVCCTLDQANRATIYNHKYDVLIVDDAHLAADADLMGSLMQPGLQQVVMLGESLFIPNILENDDDGGDDGDKRLFYQVCEFSELCAGLTEQYRAHEKLMEFSNKHFYENKLNFHWRCNHRIELTLAVSRYIDWMPQVDSMTAVFTTSSYKLIEPAIEKIIEKLITVEHVPTSAIMIITTDKYQINNRNIMGVQIRTVLDAVGLESDFVILSCDQWSHRPQRLSYELDPNFILDERAFHVAMTRARLGIFIVAQESLLDVSLGKVILRNLCREIGHIDQNGLGYHCIGWKKLVYHLDSLGTIFNSDRLR